MILQSTIRFLYPPQCLACGAETVSEFALCGACWREMPFITGTVCDGCGVPLPGAAAALGALCDSCLVAPHPWQRGRAALLYEGTARRMILALKHGDRQEMIQPMAAWLAQHAADVFGVDTLVVPVPLHWRRMVSRRFNQAAMLAAALAVRLGAECCPDLILRHRATRMQEGMSREERFANQRLAFRVPKNRTAVVAGRAVVLVDDVMTSGATLAACAEACLSAGADSVNVLVLARVARDA